MKWVLIIMMTYGGWNGGTAVTTHEFNNQTACEVAATMTQTKRPDYTAVVAFCATKGVEE